MTASGSCLCGRVRYSVEGPLRPVIACHCTQCRKTSGHHVAATSALRDCVRIEGDVAWFASSPTARRGFCCTCGSNLFWDGPGAHLSIFAGSLDVHSDLRIAGHIYCTDKGAYYDIADGLPQRTQDDPKLTKQVP
ncbi:MAG: GFA family protein [Pseudomonadota bacterium]